MWEQLDMSDDEHFKIYRHQHQHVEMSQIILVNVAVCKILVLWSTKLDKETSTYKNIQINIQINFSNINLSIDNL